MDENPINIIIRDYNKMHDEAYIYSSWRNAAFYSAFEKPTQSSKTFFREQTRVIRRILASATVRIACFEDSPIVIVGYSVFTGNHLNFILVKPDFRLKGIGKLLVPKNIETFTNELTKIGKIIVEKKNLKLKENEDGNSNRDEEIRQTN